MPTVAEMLHEAERRLAISSETPRLDAEILLAHAMGVTRAHLFASLHEPAAGADFQNYLGRREAGEPIAYILGYWEFYSLEFEVEAPILVPRPETEHLVEVVLEFAGSRRVRVLDLCTGTGCVAIAIAKHAPAAEMIATDINPAAVALARRNAEKHRVSDRLSVLEGDLFEALKGTTPLFEVICANPPYVAEGEWAGLSPTIRKYEDPRALVSGPEGLDCIRRVVADSGAHLVSGGMLALEIGQGQAGAVSKVMESAGFTQVTFREDLAKIPRIASGIWPKQSSAKEVGNVARL